MLKFLTAALAITALIASHVARADDDPPEDEGVSPENLGFALIEKVEARFCQTYSRKEGPEILSEKELDDFRQVYVGQKSPPTKIKLEHDIVLAYLAATQSDPSKWVFSISEMGFMDEKSKSYSAWIRFHLSQRMAEDYSKRFEAKEVKERFTAWMNSLPALDERGFPIIQGIYFNSRMPEAFRGVAEESFKAHGLTLPKKEDVNPAEFSKLLGAFASDTFDIREAAMQKLYSVVWKPENIPGLVATLKTTIKTTNDPEVTTRAQRLLKFYSSVQAEAGAPEKELKEACAKVLAKTAVIGENPSATAPAAGKVEKDSKQVKEDQPKSPEDGKDAAGVPKGR